MYFRFYRVVYTRAIEYYILYKQVKDKEAHMCVLQHVINGVWINGYWIAQ